MLNTEATCDGSGREVFLKKYIAAAKIPYYILHSWKQSRHRCMRHMTVVKSENTTNPNHNPLDSDRNQYLKVNLRKFRPRHNAS